MYIKFRDSNDIYEAKVIPNGNIVTLEFKGNEAVINTNGFLAYKDKKCEYLLGNYLNYTTIYRNDEETQVYNGIQLSNDGTIYVEPEPIPEPEPYIPTEEELAILFAKNKKSKIEQSKQMLAEYLENNPIVSTAHGGMEGRYSVTSEKQSLMTSQYMTYQIEKEVNPNAVLTWNETGKACEVWTEEEFLQLVLEIKAYVYPKVSHQQSIEEKINECTTQEELDAIVIDYSAV